MAVWRPRLARRLHMGEHVKVRFRIVIKLSLAHGRLVVESRRHKCRIGQQRAQARGDVVERWEQGLRRQRPVGVRTEVCEFIGHVSLPGFKRV